MKIAFYISSLSGGGAEKVLTTLANRFAAEGHDIHVISLEKRPQFYEVAQNVKLHKVDNRSKGKVFETISDVLFIKKCFQEIRADVSISFLSRCNFLVLLANLFNKERIIVCDRNNPVKEHSMLTFKLTNLIYRRANQIVVQTNQIKEYYSDQIQKKIVVIENPIDTVSLYSQLDGKDLTKENVIVSMGRLEPQKDFEALIEAFAQISNRYPDWTLKIFGIGDKLQILKKLASEKNVEDKVCFCGRTKEPFLELKRSKIFVLSSHYEGFPNVLCEAMEAGLLCISSDCVSGPNELIKNGENGWLFPVGDVDRLAELLDHCMASNDLGAVQRRAMETTKRLHLEVNINCWKKAIGEVLTKNGT